MARQVCKDSGKFIVIDDLLSSEQFEEVRGMMQTSDYVPTNLQGWNKVWRVEDGCPLASPGFRHKNSPFNNPMDIVHCNVYHVAKNNEDIAGVEGEDWNEITFRFYIYGRGTRISWHNDPGYSAAAIYYCHEEWSAYWGGELMLAHLPDPLPTEAIKISEASNKPDINRKWTSNLMNLYGIGKYISPLPNRFVMTKGDVWHAIARVDSSAGDNLRCSVVAFFEKN